MKTLIVGARPAGLMCAIESKKQNKDDEVILIEKNNEIGKKLKITGKGRCNITSSLPIDQFFKNIFNSKFLFSAFNSYTNEDILKYLNENNIQTKIERGNRVFPKSDKAIQIVDFFYKELKKYNIDLRLNTEVLDLIVKDNKVIGIKTKSQNIYADKIVIATGGRSYKLTGSDGKMLKILQKHGIDIKDFKSSLVGLELKEKNLCSSTMGLALKNVNLSVKKRVESKKENKEKNIENVDNKNKENIENIEEKEKQKTKKQQSKILYSNLGEVLFTHYGISGPLVLSSSSYISHDKDYEKKLTDGKYFVSIDLKPALTTELLEKRVLRDFEKYSNKNIQNALVDLLPKNLIELVLEKAGIENFEKVNSITKQKRENLIKTLKNLEFEVTSLRPLDEAIVSNGGIKTNVIDPKNMKSKQLENLFFAGEIIDVDGLTGGFNLQIAYSSGILSARGK